MNAISRFNDTRARIESLKKSMVLGHPQALWTAYRMRDVLVSQAVERLTFAERSVRMADGGPEFRFTDKDTMYFPAEQSLAGAGRALDEALELSVLASNVGDLITSYEGRVFEGEIGPTMETILQIGRSRGGDPFLKLYAEGDLDDFQIRAAHEIEACMRFATNGLGLKTMRFAVKSEDDPNDGPAPTREDMAARQERIALLHAAVYVPWTRYQAEDVPLIHGMIEGYSLRTVAKRAGVGREKAIQRVQDALTEYALASRQHKREEDRR